MGKVYGGGTSDPLVVGVADWGKFIDPPGDAWDSSTSVVFNSPTSTIDLTIDGASIKLSGTAAQVKSVFYTFLDQVFPRE